MFLPDFLATDFNNLKRTNNSFQRFHKLIYFNLIFMKYITIVLYQSTKLTDYKNNKISKKLYTNFVTPTEGSWLDLLELILSGNFFEIENPKTLFKKRLNTSFVLKFNQIFALLVHNNIDISQDLTVLDFFKRIVSIKNKLVSHSIITEEKSMKLIEVITPLLDEVILTFDSILKTPLLLLEENNLDCDYYCESIVGNLKIKDININEINEDGLYFVFKDKVIFSSPFLICRDGNILFYNKYDKKNKKVLYIGENTKEIYIKTASEDISEIFNLDKDSLNLKPIPVQIKVAENGTTHNLPDTDYKEFIGRKFELKELERKILHRRYFISALDGIGGVGKSAIALEFCNNILKRKPNEEIFFEYIIWLSAKTTYFKDGEIHYINQSFEHLEQLLDTILDVMAFSEYKILEINVKQKNVFQLLNSTKSLIVLDNLETIKKDNLTSIWEFLNDVPDPSKVLLTSREFHYDVPQTLRIDSLSHEDSKQFIKEQCITIGLEYSRIEEISNQIVNLSSGLPIALKSILGQLYLGKNIRTIKIAIEQNKDNLSKFCFQEQLRLLKEEHIKTLMIICLSSEDLDYDSLSYMLEPLGISNLLSIIKELISLSIIKVSSTPDTEVYTILPLIKNYILSTNKNEELTVQLKDKLSEYYKLKDSDTYTLLPIEERSIDKGALIPRKLVDMAMKHSESGEIEKAEDYFKRALKDYSNESYVWYMYAMYLAQYSSKISDAINALKKADELLSNYIYNKKIGDFHLRLKNYQAAIKNYKLAMNKATIDKNRDEMLYQIGFAEYSRAKYIRQLLKKRSENTSIEERNDAYKSCIDSFLRYIDTQPNIYDVKLIKIYRMLSESYFGIKDKENALKFIDTAIEISEGDEYQLQYREFILRNDEREFPNKSFIEKTVS